MIKSRPYPKASSRRPACRRGARRCMASRSVFSRLQCFACLLAGTQEQGEQIYMKGAVGRQACPGREPADPGWLRSHRSVQDPPLYFPLSSWSAFPAVADFLEDSSWNPVGASTAILP